MSSMAEKLNAFDYHLLGKIKRIMNMKMKTEARRKRSGRSFMK
jgi:hypothetical protein